jgi:hypothetical protein
MAQGWKWDITNIINPHNLIVTDLAVFGIGGDDKLVSRFYCDLQKQ